MITTLQIFDSILPLRAGWSHPALVERYDHSAPVMISTDYQRAEYFIPHPEIWAVIRAFRLPL
jgi:hypothetical protein